MTSIFKACATGNLAAVRELVAADPTIVNARDDMMWTPLHHATDGNKLDVVKFLVENKAALDTKSPYGMTALHYATEYDRFEVARILVANKATLDVKDNCGQTPLYCAARRGRLDTVEILVKNGADVNARTEGGWTPLHYAAFVKNPKVFEYLWPLCRSVPDAPELKSYIYAGYRRVPSDTDFKWTHEMNHAARVCLVLAEMGLSIDMITQPLPCIL
jgi:ankyrin repeat protein